jgi:CO/xanthine dehydrogenase FAD-binding subunit
LSGFQGVFFARYVHEEESIKIENGGRSMGPSYFEDLEGFAKFEYIEPKTIKEACSLLSQYKEKAKVIAGGTKILASIKEKEISPQYLINLKNVSNLEYINYGDEEGLKIGALTTLFDISRSSIVNDKAKIFAEAIQQRELDFNKTRWAYYMATLGGHLSNSKTSAEITPPMLVLEAKAVIEGPKGWKTIPIEEFFTNTGAPVVQSDEVIIEIRIPKQPAEMGLVFMKSLRTNDVPTFNVAILLKLDEKHVNIEDLKIVVSGITPNPLEVHEAEGIMKGKAIDNDLIEETAQAAAREVADRSGMETLGKAKELIEEAIRQAVDRAIGDFALGY